MELKNILLEWEGAMATITMNRPDALNALNSATLRELDQVFSTVLLTQGAHVVILTGAGKAFVAGADIKEMAEMNAEEARQFSLLGQSVFRKIETFPYPVVVAVNGYALGGGCELALAADLRIASDKAKFGQPEVNLGVIPGFGGTQRLTQLVGMAKAKEMIFTGDMITAVEAMALGLVNAVYEPSALMPKAKEMAQKMLTKGPLALSYAKQAMNLGNNMPLSEAIAMEAQLFALSFATQDQKEGMKAFMEKRTASFKGK